MTTPPAQANLGLSMTIRVLPQEVVSRIAAGEVVERPASVVKELVENALDAGATQIKIELRGGGVELIRVLDNGRGIPAEEVELAFHRYATSKIQQLSDLENITTLGFRGEALPSIVQVATVELLTQSAEEPVGTYLSLKEGQITQSSHRARPPGTSVTVRHLFQSFPARLRFLKSLATENGQATAVVTHYALAYPEVQFMLTVEGRDTLRTSGSGQLRDAALEVYGADVAEALLEVRAQPGVLPAVTGLVSLPPQGRSNRSGQSFFVNRRWVRNPLLGWGLEEAYQGLLPEGRHPIAILHISIPPGEVEVNIHPAKTEVKFRHERAVLLALQQAVGQALGRVPSPGAVEAPIWGVAGGEAVAGEMPLPLTLPTAPPLLRVIGQVANCYIVAEGPDGIYLIDQHTAHERILYEKLLAQREKQGVEVQGLLDPLLLEVEARSQRVIQSCAEALSQYGFTLEPFGDGTYLVRSVPAVLRKDSIKEALTEVLDSLAQGDEGQWQRQIATSIACHGAVKAGQALSYEEMRELVRGLEQCQLPRLCPHGRPIILHLSAEHLERQFGRR